MNPALTTVTQREYFSALADAVCIEGADVDRCSLLLKAEDSHFIRFNHGRVRQATHVAQGHVTLSAMQHARRIESRIALSGRLQDDIKLLRAERAALAHSLADVPDDPYLLLPSSATHSERHDLGSLPDPDTLVRVVAETAAGLDFVGFYAGGPVVRAFADNLGTRHWHHVQSFHLEWCLYLTADRAVKSTYAGTQWSSTEFARRVADAARSLQLLAQPAHTPPAGDYRAYIAPAAMAELLGTLSWSGFGLKARRTGTSSLMRLAHRDASLHGDMSLSEDTAHGLAPAFTADGFARPASVPLVLAGVAAQTLNSARSAREFGLQNNGANAQEVPESLNLGAGPPGRLPQGEALAALDRGLYIANLWYLNYSDRPACRMTGMTRFACLWVEGGRAVAPLSVMRFDDSFLRLFGEGLIGLGDSAELIADGSTYQERQLGSVTTPGALVEGLRLTL